MNKFEVRVVSYKNINGSYWAVQIGRKVNGRWKTAGGILRREKLFCIEKQMKNNEPGEYERASKETKAEAEAIAEQWRQQLASPDQQGQ